MSIVAIQLANYTLSFLMWMIVGRGLLRLIIGERRNLMMLAFVKVTEPVFGLTRRVLPSLGERWVPVATFFLLAAARVAMILLFHPAADR
jgi:uncharacterized protein YggT (Ycf19 family)